MKTHQLHYDEDGTPFLTYTAEESTAMKTQLQEQHDFKRKQYMENEISHKEFYLWLADSIGITVSDLPVPIEKIRASHDEHLNDITLRLWDAKDPIVRGKAVRAGMRSWSLSDTVCVLKNFARKVAA